MTSPTQRADRLVRRGGAGLACDQEGLALGGVDLAGVQTDERGMRRCVMRPPEEIAEILGQAMDRGKTRPSGYSTRV